MSKTFTYIGAKNLRLDPETNEHVEIAPTFRGYEFPKGKAVTVTDPVAIAKLSANPDFEEVKAKPNKSDSKGGDTAGGQSAAGAAPTA